MRCACGFEATPDCSLGDHLGEVFIPDGDMGPDGVRHAEDGRDRPGRSCLCGFAAGTSADLDEHILAAFLPAGGIAPDGTRHELLTGPG